MNQENEYSFFRGWLTGILTAVVLFTIFAILIVFWP